MTEDDEKMIEAAKRRQRAAYRALRGCKPHPAKKKNPSRTVSSLKKLGREKTKFTWKSCERKTRFNSQGEASTHLHKWESKSSHKGRVYQCPLCGGWHVTFEHDGFKL